MRFCLLFAAVAIARCQTGAIPFYEDPLANISYTEKDACAPYQGLLIDPDQELGVCYPCSYYAVSRPIGDEFIGGPGYVCVDKEVRLCDLGKYCPFNETSGAYDAEFDCDDGEFCPPGMLEPIDCGPLYVCTGEVISAGIGGVIFILVLVGLLLALYCCSSARSKQQAALSLSLKQQLAKEDDADDFDRELKTAQIIPITLELQQVGLKLKATKKYVLRDVSAHFPNGSMVALMGASGSGKTTLMNTLLDRVPYGIPEGIVRVNGVVDGLAKAANLTGFVPQDDIVHHNLTVFQNLYYHAMLRLPADKPHAEKLHLVQQVVHVLSLEKVQNVVVGNEENRGISGGQKKRVNIGMELVTMPSVLFLDEPTSGLDGAATIALARCLAMLRRSGITIICVIHQPRFAVFQLFTHLLLLGEGGGQIYSGRVEYIEGYLTSFGFKRPELENPADWMIDVACNLEKRHTPDGEADRSFECPRDLYAAWNKHHRASALSPSSVWHRGDPPPRDAAADAAMMVPRKTAPSRVAVYYLVGRAFRQTAVGDVTISCVFLVFIALLNAPALITGDWSWDSLPSKLTAGNLLFGIVIGVTHRQDYGNQKVILYREVNSSMSVLALFVAITLKACLVGFFQTLAYTIITYIIAAPQQNFVIFFITWFGFCLWWISFSHWVSLCTQQTLSLLLLLFGPVVEAFYSGDVGSDAQVEELEPFTSRSLRLVSAFSASRWHFQALYSQELLEYPEHVRTFTAVNASLYWRLVPTELESGASAGNAALYGFAWWNVIVLGGFGITFVLLWFMQAAHKRKLKRCFAAICCCGSSSSSSGGVLPNAEAADVQLAASPAARVVSQTSGGRGVAP